MDLVAARSDSSGISAFAVGDFSRACSTSNMDNGIPYGFDLQFLYKLPLTLNFTIQGV